MDSRVAGEHTDAGMHTAHLSTLSVSWNSFALRCMRSNAANTCACGPMSDRSSCTLTAWHSGRLRMASSYSGCTPSAKKHAEKGSPWRMPSDDSSTLCSPSRPYTSSCDGSLYAQWNIFHTGSVVGLRTCLSYKLSTQHTVGGDAVLASTAAYSAHTPRQGRGSGERGQRCR